MIDDFVKLLEAWRRDKLALRSRRVYGGPEARCFCLRGKETSVEGRLQTGTRGGRDVPLRKPPGVPIRPGRAPTPRKEGLPFASEVDQRGGKWGRWSRVLTTLGVVAAAFVLGFHAKAAPFQPPSSTNEVSKLRRFPQHQFLLLGTVHMLFSEGRRGRESRLVDGCGREEPTGAGPSCRPGQEQVVLGGGAARGTLCDYLAQEVRN